MQEFKWYVVRVITGQEKKIKDYIELELEREKLSSFVKNILIPLEKVVQLRNGKKVTREKNFFPGYVLIEVSLETEVFHTIKGVNGVVGFLGNKDEPIPMRDSEIERILSKVNAMQDEVESLEVPFMVGETVRIIDGPFNTFIGTVDHVNENAKRLKVIVKIFGRKTIVELNYMQVEKE